ncbi:MAG: BlaI/MecI/CopY family transcriptional regulator [Acidobacteria bacterium]|nr:BlaI/MecI/CopY family transcriptional regulator [Acidobacteriota bacterium]
MPRTPQQLTPLELEIMNILWEHGPGNVQAVAQHLAPRDGEPLAYTTVQTMLNVLHRKGKVRRELVDRAYVYTPELKRREARGAAVRDLVDRMFGGSAESLVMGLLETDQLTPERLKALQEKLSAAKAAGAKVTGIRGGKK